jgi:hypothetical protein
MARYIHRSTGLRAAAMYLLLLALAFSQDPQVLAQPTAAPDRQGTAPQFTRTGTVDVPSLPGLGAAGATAGGAARHERRFLVPDRNAYNRLKTAPQPGGRPADEPPAAAGPAAQASAASAGPRPQRFTNFGGLNQADNPFALAPPDNGTAAGPAHVFEMVNITGRIWSRTGEPLTLPFLLSSFFGLPASTYITDPRIKFDPDAQRWFAVAVGFQPNDSGGYAAIAVSNDANPFAGFNVYYAPFVGQLPDYPAMGMSHDKLAISFNAYACGVPCSSTLDGFLGTEFFILNKADLVAGAQVLGQQFFPPPQGLFTIQPAMNYNDPTASQPPENALRMAAVDFPTAIAVRVWTLTGLPPAVSVATTDLPITSLTIPPLAQQRGTTTLVQTNDNRLLDAAWRRYRQGNEEVQSLWLSANDACAPKSDNVVRSCARYIEIQTGGVGPQVRQDFDLGRPYTYFYFPALAIDRLGNLLSVVSESSPGGGSGPPGSPAREGDFPSVVVTGRRVNAPPNTIHAPTTLKAGEAPYIVPPYLLRYGDYSAANIDPVDQTKAWVGGEYSRNTQQVPPYQDWGTWIGQIGF